MRCDVVHAFCNEYAVCVSVSDKEKGKSSLIFVIIFGWYLPLSTQNIQRFKQFRFLELSK